MIDWWEGFYYTKDDRYHDEKILFRVPQGYGDWCQMRFSKSEQDAPKEQLVRFLTQQANK
jgi:hypothetical protein